MSTFRSWIEAMRLRTLPVSIAGVLAGTAVAIAYDGFSPIPALVCLIFALGAQIVSNFANEYFDWRNGLDRKGREGFRRGVTEGDISPRTMLIVTIALLAVTCFIGSILIIFGGWWLIFIGIAVAIFALAYSTGPYPLSHHGLGDVAVILFFGLVPVLFTAYVQTGNWDMWPIGLTVGLAVGMLSANVLIVNNYRDMDDDRTVGKRTTVVIFGRRNMAYAYLIGGFIAAALLTFAASIISQQPAWILGPVIYIYLHFKLYNRLITGSGADLNPLLGATARLLLFLTLWLLCLCIYSTL